MSKFDVFKRSNNTSNCNLLGHPITTSTYLDQPFNCDLNNLNMALLKRSFTRIRAGPLHPRQHPAGRSGAKLKFSGGLYQWWWKKKNTDVTRYVYYLLLTICAALVLLQWTAHEQ